MRNATVQMHWWDSRVGIWLFIFGNKRGNTHKVMYLAILIVVLFSKFLLFNEEYTKFK